MELISKEQLDKADFGSAHIPTETLEHLDSGNQHPLEAALGWLTRENPSYSFSGVFDAKAGGATVFWRPMEVGNQ